MKQLLTVIAIVLSTSLAQSFTTVSKTSYETPVCNSIKTKGTNWSHTTWVNPWIGVNQNKTGNKTVGAAIINWTWSAPSIPIAPPANFKISVNNVVVVELTAADYMGGTGQFFAAAGSTVKVEITVNSMYGLTVLISDETTDNDLYYSDSSSQITYSFTATGDHEFNVYADA